MSLWYLHIVTATNAGIAERNKNGKTHLIASGLDMHIAAALVCTHNEQVRALEETYVQDYELCMIALDAAGVIRTRDGMMDFYTMADRVWLLTARANQSEAEAENLAAQISTWNASWTTPKRQPRMRSEPRSDPTRSTPLAVPS